MLVGGFGCAVSSPPVNNSDSPGSSGNSSPVSMKTMTRIPGSTALPKTPPEPSQYIGSRMSGRAVTTVLTMLQHTGLAILDGPGRQEEPMPIATPEIYAEMLGRAKDNAYAFPAINCTSSETVNAAIKGFADAGSDGIIQFSTGGAEFASGLGVKDMVAGAVALAKFTRSIAAKYPINVALHTDHCPKDKLDTYVRPLLEISAQRVAAGKNPLFQSHMWDGSAVPLDENLAIAQELLKQAAAAKIVLEIEIGVVGGEEDGVVGEINDKL